MGNALIRFEDYPRLLALLSSMPEDERRAKCRNLCRTDLYFLLRYAFGRADVAHPWLFARCREVQASPNGHMDLWAREHYKSTIITFAKSIQDILASHGEDPLPEWKGREVSIGIFSHARPIAKKFLRQIKTELEANEQLKEWFPDVLYADPRKQAAKWAEDEGIVVKRRSNPGEATVEAWGLVDGQPIGKHFVELVYDDVVTRESVNTPDMIQKTTEYLSLSYALGTDGGVRRFIGTRYHYNDTYRTILERETAKARIYPAIAHGDASGNGVLLDAKTLADKRRDMGPYSFASQFLLDPRADDVQGFSRDWLRYYNRADGRLNKYILVDPASSRKKGSDYTAIWVVGLGLDENYYVLDIVRDRLSLTERADAVISLHRKWKPLQVRYEQYGLQADIEHLRDRMERESYRFDLKEVGGQTSKLDRIKRLVPLFENGRIWLPKSLAYTDREDRARDLVRDFVEDEYAAFPVGVHDDMLDALARIAEPDMPLRWPSAALQPTIVPTYEPSDEGVGM